MQKKHKRIVKHKFCDTDSRVLLAKMKQVLVELKSQKRLGTPKTALLHLDNLLGITAHPAQTRLDAKCNCNPQLQLFEPEILPLHDYRFTVLGLTFLPFPLFVGLASAVCWWGFQEK